MSAIVAFVMWRVLSTTGEESSTTGEGEKIPSGYEKVVLGNLTLTVEGTGTVEPRTTTRVKSEATGIVQKLFVKEGDFVEKGDVIAILDQEDLQLRLKKAIIAEKQAKLNYEQARNSNIPRKIKSAEARVEDLKLSLESAKEKLERVLQLYERGYASVQEVDDAKTYVKSLEVQLEEAENNLRILKEQDLGQSIESARLSWELAKVELEEARKALGDATIRSPITGTVLKKFVEEGDTVISSRQGFSEGTVICTIADLSEVQVRGNIDEVDIGLVQIGQKADVIVDTYPDRVYEGIVTNIFPEGEKQPGGLTTFTVIVSVQNEDKSLLANMTATIKIKTKEIKNVLLVPFEAIQPGEREGETIVYVRNEKGLPEERKVVLGATDYKYYEVKEGLKEGELVKVKNFPLRKRT